jgi:hypothetical protein
MTISDWKRAIYALLALPGYLGGTETQRSLARRWLGAPPTQARPRYLAALASSVAAFLVALLLLFLVWRIATYGFFWKGDDPEGTWGGPTLLGAWVVHFFVALGMSLPCLWLLRPLTSIQARLLS